MESNVKRIEEALERLHEAARKAIEVFPNDDRYQSPLQVISSVTPDAVGSKMFRYAHAHLCDGLAEVIETCGYADPELVAVVNGAKELIERIDGRWCYEEGRWHDRSELGERASRARAEVAK